MPARKPHTVNMASALPPTCRPSAVMADLHVFGKYHAVHNECKNVDDHSPRITRVQLIFPMLCSFGPSVDQSRPGMGGDFDSDQRLHVDGLKELLPNQHRDGPAALAHSSWERRDGEAGEQ